MDIDKEFVRSIIRGGKDAVMAAIDRSIDKEILLGKEKTSYLFGEGKKGWTFLREHFVKYDEVPSIEAIESSTGIDLSGSMNESYQFFLDEIFKRRLFQLQRHGIKDVSEKLEGKDPVEAAALWDEIHRKIGEESLTVKRVESLLSLGKQVMIDYKDAKAGKRGMSTPWPSMDGQTLGWWPEDLILFVGRLGVGKCLGKDSLIQDVTGVQHTIEEVYNREEITKVSTWSKESGIHPIDITAKVDTGYKECLKFTLGTGREIEVTPEHPLMTPDGWKRADAIAVGDSVAVAARMPFAIEPMDMLDAEVDLLAILLADGSCTTGHCEFTKSDQEIVNIASKAALAIGSEVSEHSKANHYGVRGQKRDDNPALDLIRRHGVAGHKSVDKTIPDCIFRLGKKQLARFLSTFWMCDGYVDKTHGPGLILASKKMLQQIQSLLLRFGIQSKFSYKPAKLKGKTFPAWRLRVYSFCQKAFMDEFTLWGHKLESLEACVARDKNSNVGFPLLSKELRAEIEVLSRSRSTGRWGEGLIKEVGKRLGWKSKFMTKSMFGANNSLLIERFKVFCDVYGCTDKYKWLWASDIYWDTVSSIENVGVQKIYDLTVEPTSCFIANDIVVHNTWSLVICAHRAWQEGNKVLIVSTEMNEVQMAKRFLALQLKISYNDIRKGTLSEFAEEKFYKDVEALLSDKGVDIVSGGFDFSIDNISTVISDNKPKLMCLDGPYLIKNSGKDRHEKVSNTFEDLKKMGKKYKHATITNLQFNRSAKTGQSQTISADNVGVTDVAGWTADAMYGLVQSEEMKTNWQMGIKGMKIREGIPDEFAINWNHSAMDFSEIGVVSTPIKDSRNSAGNAGGGDSTFATEEDDFDDVPF